MTRTGHLDDVKAHALAPTLWSLVQAWLVSQRKPKHPRRRARKTR
jgi:hypothetical protein